MIYRIPRALTAAFLTLFTMLGLRGPAYADPPGGHHFLNLWAAVTSLNTLAALFGAAIVFYAISVGLTIVLAKGMYPPNAARLGCWLGILGWAAFIVFGLFDYGFFGLFGLLGILFLPWWETILVFSIILLLGILLFVTAKRTAR